MFTRLVLCTALVGFVLAGPASLITKKCTADDNKCIKDTATAVLPEFVKGIPEFGIETLDPLHINEIDASNPSLKLIIRNITLNGLKGCKPKKIVRDIPKSKMYVRLVCDIDAEGQYEMKGKLLVLPIEGNDKAHLKINKLHLAADLDMEEKMGDDGKKHWHIQDFKHSFELKEKAHLVFDNLFQNSPLLRDAANDAVKQNSNEIIKEVGPPVIKFVADIMVSTVNKFFSHVAAEELEVV